MRYTRLALGVLLFAHAPVFAQQCRTIDFDTDASGAAISPATEITDQYEAWGVMISYVPNVPGEGPLLAFNTNAPTGGDIDLGSPNGLINPGGNPGCVDGAPGIGNTNDGGGNAGEFNCPVGVNDGRLPSGGLNNALIIQEEGETDPDDGDGGFITFEFDRDVMVRQINFLDDLDGGVELYDAGDAVIGSLTWTDNTTSDNGYYPFSLPNPPALGIGESFTGDNSGVRKLVAEIDGSGAITGVEFCELYEFSVPSSSHWSLTLMAAMLALFGVAAFRRRV